MHPLRLIWLPALIFCQLMLTGCLSVPYGIYDDKRLIDTITSDKAIAADVKTTLMNENFTQGWEVSVFCYYGKVFLAGEVPSRMQSKAVSLAASRKGVRSVTTHWFSPRTAESSDLALATRLRTNLISTEGLSSTRIDTVVNANRVVLFGVVNDDKERQLAIRAARLTEGVQEVTSYLITPL